MAICYAQSTVSTTNAGGVIYRLNVGEVWDDNDQLVKEHPNLFSKTPPRIRTSRGWVPPEAVIETATAAPGEKRRTKRS